jgi:hypothetical protein
MMTNIGKLAFAAVAGVAFLTVIFMAAAAHARPRGSTPPPPAARAIPDPNTFSIGYFDLSEPDNENGTGAGDNILHLINPTSTDPICAMIYVFDDNQEMGECCGCPLTTNHLLSLSVQRQLTSNWEIGDADFDNGVLKIVSAVPNHFNRGDVAPNGACHDGCDPTVPYVLAPGLVGSILKSSEIGGGPFPYRDQYV